MGDLNERHQAIKTEISEALLRFSRVKPEQYFYELCFCLLTPQSNAYKCDEAVQLLKKQGFYGKDIDPKPFLRNKTRFYINKSVYLEGMKQNYNEIFEIITSDILGYEKREFLVKNVKGLGYKEASHFLRNIGHRNLAILDRHILRNMKRHGAIRSIPRSITPKKYFLIEKKFMKFSDSIGIPMDELDLLFWANETGKVFK